MLAADWIGELGLQLAHLSEAGAQALAPLLPAQATLANLLDLSEEAGPEHFCAAIQACARDAQIDGILVIYSPKLGGDPPPGWAVSCLRLGCLLPGGSAGAAHHQRRRPATFRTPEAAVGAFGNIASFYENKQLLQQTPPPLSDLAKPDVEGARMLIESVLAKRRKVLTEMESKALLAAFHIPVTKTILARSVNEAIMIATQLGFPVALKVDSPDISHKSDVQGVALNVLNAAAGARRLRRQ